jgi:hypothetical protein
VVLVVTVAGVATGDVELQVATACVVVVAAAVVTVVVAPDVQAPNNTAALINPHMAYRILFMMIAPDDILRICAATTN